MILHGKDSPSLPARVVILGATGVIGRAAARHLRTMGAEVVTLGSREVDLCDADADVQLAVHLRPQDAIVMLAALTPDRGRDLGTMSRNLAMAVSVCAALRRVPPSHLVYASSDAVYPMGEAAVTERTPVEARDGYAAMHLAREDLFRRLSGAPVAVLRATQVCSDEDTHHAYGPVRFREQAATEGRISLFGGGEETRDHIMADDVARVIGLCLAHRSAGTLNVATGRSLSFREVAGIVAAHCTPRPEIRSVARSQPVTHRVFDVSALRAAFPSWIPQRLEDGIAAFYRTDAPRARGA